MDYFCCESRDSLLDKTLLQRETGRWLLIPERYCATPPSLSSQEVLLSSANTIKCIPIQCLQDYVEKSSLNRSSLIKMERPIDNRKAYKRQ